MWTSREKILAAAVIVTVILAAVIVLAVTWRIKSVGRIKAIGVGVFWDPNCTLSCTDLDWGLIGAGELAGVTLYVKNTRNVNLTLTLNSTEYMPPEAQQYLTLEWNYTGLIIQPEQVSPIQLTLYVSLNITDIDVFSFDILITAAEA